MKRRNQGQILPFAMIIIVILAYFIFSNFEIAYLNFKKVKQQKETDAFALAMANNYARGLNVLAAYNEGLVIAKNRTKLVTLVTAAVTACAAAWIPPCIRAERKLIPKVTQYYSRVNKLGKTIEQNQKQIISWMANIQCDLQTVENIKKPTYVYPDIFCDHRNRNEPLPFHRSISTDFTDTLIPVHIPEPLVLTNDFFNEKNKIIIAQQPKIESVMADSHGGFLKSLGQHLWTMSEVKINGENFEKMEFTPTLHAISLQSELWKQIKHNPTLSTEPTIGEFEHEISH